MNPPLDPSAVKKRFQNLYMNCEMQFLKALYRLRTGQTNTTRLLMYLRRVALHGDDALRDNNRAWILKGPSQYFWGLKIIKAKLELEPTSSQGRKLFIELVEAKEQGRMGPHHQGYIDYVKDGFGGQKAQDLFDSSE